MQRVTITISIEDEDGQEWVFTATKTPIDGDERELIDEAVMDLLAFTFRHTGRFPVEYLARIIQEMGRRGDLESSKFDIADEIEELMAETCEAIRQRCKEWREAGWPHSHGE